jgi:NADH-quinone oxidoreductase subunit F
VRHMKAGKIRSPEELKKAAEQAKKARRKYRGRVLACMTGCRALGAADVVAAFREKLAAAGLNEEIEVVETGCIGLCARAPVVLIEPYEYLYGRVKPQDVDEIIEKTIRQGKPVESLVASENGKFLPTISEVGFYKDQQKAVLANCGRIDPKKIEDAIARGGYQAASKALRTMTPQQVIEEVTKSGLRGRGGAGFLTGLKWRFCRESPGNEKYLICNADEGDPGAFMDRAMKEGDPHRVIEGMIIAAYAIGASYGFVYVRAEYPIAVEHTNIALDQARKLGLLGKNILGSGFNFDIELRMGAGAFVCGEETALIASLEGKRGMPRPRPPFPAQKGYHGKPTNINNVETFANVPLIINNGAAWYASIGTEGSKGTKIFALAGKVNNTGLVEVPMGATLRQIVFDVGGGIQKGRRFKAAQMGGPSGGCVPAQFLDLPIDYDTVKNIGAIMGSGGLIVMDENTCMVDIARFFLQFVQSESCGKCTPCRVGTKKMLQILQALCRGEAKMEDLDRLEQLARHVGKASLCGLGQTAPNPVLSTLRYFRHEYEEHVRGYCSSMVCKSISPAPCQRTCPIGMDVPSYIALTGWGRFKEALDVMHQDNPFPAVCGRICPRPCESNCTRFQIDKPLAIRALKRFIADQMAESSPLPAAKFKVTRPQRLAVVGAGPCGLTAAHDLAELGYAVTVFESRRQAGGMLRHAVPDFRLSKDTVDREVARIASVVTIRAGQTLGKDFTLEQLFHDGFSAVLLATGAARGVPLTLSKSPKPGDYLDAVKFLVAAKKGKATCPGKQVVVIGTGHLAIDAARTAVRLGASKVILLHATDLEHLAIPPDELIEATAEGVTFQYNCLPVEVVTKGGHTKAVRCLKTSSDARDETGRQRPKPIVNSEFSIPCDAVISAMGHRPDTSCLKNEPNIRRGILDNIIVDPLTLETVMQGVFAAGDVVVGGATVIEAIAAGQRAAMAIHRRLNNLPTEARFKLPKPRRRVEFYEVEEELESFTRPAEPLLNVETRKKSFDEAVCTYSVETAMKESKRCLRCDLE